MEAGQVTLSGDARRLARRPAGARGLPRRGGVSATGRPEREHRSAQHEGNPVSEHRGALREGRPVTVRCEPARR